MAASQGMMGLAAAHGCMGDYKKAVQLLGIKSPKWGSGLDGKQLASLSCANVDVAAHHVCQNPGKLCCSKCGLVVYCSKTCQKQHFRQHKVDCNSKLAAPDWRPWWERQGRPAPFVSRDGNSFQERMMRQQPKIFFWGNMPAFSLVPASDSAPSGPPSTSTAAARGTAAGVGGDEGLGQQALVTPGTSHICFAASGDLRNVVYTVNHLPDEYKGKLVVHINDVNPPVVARNLAMLLTLLKGGEEAVDAVIQMWYSTALTADQLSLVMQLLSGALGFCEEEREMDGRLLKPDGSETQVRFFDLADGKVAGPITFDLGGGASSEHQEPAAGRAPGSTNSAAAGPSSGDPKPARPAAAAQAGLVVECEDSVWRLFAAMLMNSVGLQEMMAQRGRIIHQDDRTDKLQRHLKPMAPHERVAWQEFYNEGILLPFGALNAHHNVANRWLVLPRVGWVLGAGSDPLQGWPPAEVEAAGRAHKVPPNDMYGALFFYLRDQLTAFLARLRRTAIEFRVTCMDALDLAPRLAKQGILLDYIDVSNIGDPNYAGISRVLGTWGPLLNSRANPTATLVSLFMNWVAALPDLDTSGGFTEQEFRAKMEELAKSQRATLEPRWRADPVAALNEIMFGEALDQMRERHDYSPAFERFLREAGAYTAAGKAGLRPRDSAHHRIVPPRLFVPLGAPRSTPAYQGMPEKQVHLGRCLVDSVAMEQYVEWIGAQTAD